MAGSASVIRLPAVAALLLLTAACAGHPQGPAPGAPACPAGDTAMVQATLFFGLDRPGGAPQITPREFDRFVDEVVSPTFPDGFTIQQAEGGWRDTETGATIREPSRTILILAPAADAAEASALRDRIDRVRSAYIQAFDQQAVGLASARACVDF
ncbi:DUF3574 domain-containing protein [Tistrella mobilis]|uniref:DUF3574 domain-containing protein n=1 Tax=Tistrella mobilis TaxID=171437 RepID=UPI003558CA71